MATSEEVTEDKGIALRAQSPTGLGKKEDDDHDQDPLTKHLLHIWSWSSESLLLRRRESDDHDQNALKKHLLHVWSWLYAIST